MTQPILNPFNQALNQSKEQSEQEQMFKQMLLQAFGFSPIMPTGLGYAPGNKPVMILDDKAYTRDSALDQPTRELLKQLLGISRESRPQRPPPLAGFSQPPIESGQQEVNPFRTEQIIQTLMANAPPQQQPMQQQAMAPMPAPPVPSGPSEFDMLLQLLEEQAQQASQNTGTTGFAPRKQMPFDPLFSLLFGGGR